MWYELGEREGVEIIDDEELEAEIEMEQEDKEVARIYKESKH